MDLFRILKSFCNRKYLHKGDWYCTHEDKMDKECEQFLCPLQNKIMDWKFELKKEQKDNKLSISERQRIINELENWLKSSEGYEKTGSPLFVILNKETQDLIKEIIYLIKE